MIGPVTDGMAWVDIARSAYRAYAASTGNNNFRGDPMPKFDDLPASIQIAWEAAIRQAGDCLYFCKTHGPPLDEARWAGWIPAQFASSRKTHDPTGPQSSC